MKKFLVLSLVMSMLVGMSNLAAFADNKGYISVNTTANTEIAPDVAEISFAVITSDLKSMQKATLANEEISDRVYVELKNLIDTNNGDYIKTSDFSANPIYSYVNSKKIFDRYEVSNRVIVHTKSIEKVGKMIDSAIAVGATNVDNLSFSVSNYESQCNELISVAAKKAKTRAEVIAQSLLTSISGINNISSSCSTNNYNQPRLYMAKNMISDVVSSTGSSESTTISNGVVRVNASVNASFFGQ